MGRNPLTFSRENSVWFKPKLTEVLFEAYQRGFTTQSDFARANSIIVAIAASEGLITTKVKRGTWDNTWRVTTKGLEVLQEL